MEQAVIVHLPFDEENSSLDDIYKLEEMLEKAIENAEVSEFDGDEVGEGECVLYMYGPDADRLFEVAQKILTSSGLAGGGHVIKRYGEADDPKAKEVRISL